VITQEIMEKLDDRKTVYSTYLNEKIAEAKKKENSAIDTAIVKYSNYICKSVDELCKELVFETNVTDYSTTKFVHNGEVIFEIKRAMTAEFIKLELIEYYLEKK